MSSFHCPSDVLEAHQRWGANCGPSAIAAALGLELADVRKAVSRGRSRYQGYMSIPDVVRACSALERPLARQASNPGPMAEWAREGTHIAMVQIHGPWDRNRFESAKRRHLVAARWRPLLGDGLWMVYDVNAGAAGGWLPARAWIDGVMDGLAGDQDVYPGSTGRWSFSWRGTVADATPENDGR